MKKFFKDIPKEEILNHLLSGKTAEQVGKLYGVKTPTVRLFCKRHGIGLRFFNKDLSYHDKDWLIDKYVNKNMSVTAIAKLCSSTGASVFTWLVRHGIAINRKEKISVANTNRENREEYCAKLSAAQYKRWEKVSPADRMLQFKKSMRNRKKRIYLDDNGDKCFSSLEVIFANSLIRNSISFVKEVPIGIGDNSVKVVDFVVDGRVIVEVSGFCFQSWRTTFLTKMAALRERTDQPILVLTYPKFILPITDESSILRVVTDSNILVGSIYDEVSFLKKLRFLIRLSKMSEQENIYENVSNKNNQVRCGSSCCKPRIEVQNATRS